MQFSVLALLAIATSAIAFPRTPPYPFQILCKILAKLTP